MSAGFTVPNRADVAYAPLARLDAAHLKILAAGLEGTGVVNNVATPLGCAATATGTDRNITITAGTCAYNTALVAVAGGVVTPAAGDANYGRLDLIVSDQGGALSIVAGTAAPTPTYADPPTDKIVLWGVYVRANDTSLAQNQLQDLRCQIPAESRYDGELIQRNQVARLIAYGHSLVGGTGATEGGFDALGHLANMLNIRVVKRTNGGARLHWSQSFGAGGGVGDGGYAYILQLEEKTIRANTTLTANANSGQAILTVASTTSFAVGDLVHVGTGSTAVTGGETAYVLTVDSGTQLTLRSNLVRNHLNTEPVYVVPTAYLKLNPLYFLWYTIADLAETPITSSQAKFQTRWTDVLRLTLARFRASEIFENDHTSMIYTGTWAANSTTKAANSGNNMKQASVAGDYVEWHVPDNFPGGSVYMGVVQTAGGFTTPGRWDFLIDGVSAGSLDVYPNDTGKSKGACKRFTNLAAGRHIIRATAAALGAGGGFMYFDHAGVEATEPPLIVCPLFHRLPSDYVFFAPSGGWSNGPRFTTLTGTHGIGSTVITIASTTGWMPGQTIIFENGGANQEAREIQSVDSATQVTLVAATTISHAGGTAVRVGISDPDITAANTITQTVLNEFGERVLSLDVDPLVNANPAYWSYDQGHFNDLGYSVFAKAWYDRIMLAPGFSPTLLAKTAVATSPLPSHVIFIAGGVTWTNQPAAVTELLGVTTLRHIVDVRRAATVFMYGGCSVAGAAGAKVWLEYSTDNQVTWKSMGRDSNMEWDTQTARDRIGIPIDTTNAVSMSLPQPVPYDAVQKGVIWLRVQGINGDGVADPAFRTLGVYFG